MRRRSYAVAAAGALLLAAAPAQARAAAVTPVGCSTLALTTAISTAAAGDTLVLTSYCVYTLADADGPQNLNVPLTIQGNNATIRRDPAATTDFRIFQIRNVAVAMDTLTIMNGNPGSGPGDNGGGVLLNVSGGSLTATDVNFQGNSASSGGALYAGSGTTVSLTRGTVKDNRAGAFGGGGVRALGGTTVTLDSVTVSGNRSTSNAGGVWLTTSMPSAITNSTISGNTAQLSGGGLYYSGNSTLTVTGTTIANNRVTNSDNGAGGVQVDSRSPGAVTITDSTISGNVVKGFTVTNGLANGGGGLRLQGGSLTLDNTTVSGNQIIGDMGLGAGIAARSTALSASTLTLQNGTTVTGNLASGRYARGGGLHTANGASGVTVSVTDSHIDGNKVTGTGSSAGGVFNVGATYAFATSSVNDNIAPPAPAPGGISTSVAITTVDGATTFTGNTPTNCLLSPAAVTNCVN